MKKLILSLSTLVLLFSSCENDPSLEDVPSCIQQDIKNASRNGSSEATVTQYIYNGQNVYAFDPGIVYPDIMFTVVNEACEVICQIGGIAGLNTCPDFNENAEIVGVIWRNN